MSEVALIDSKGTETCRKRGGYSSDFSHAELQDNQHKTRQPFIQPGNNLEKAD